MAATMTETFSPHNFSISSKDQVSPKDYNDAVQELIKINHPGAGCDSDNEEEEEEDLAPEDDMESVSTAPKTNGKRRRAQASAFSKQKAEEPEIVVVTKEKQDNPKPPTRYAKRTTKTNNETMDPRPRSSLRTMTGLDHFKEPKTKAISTKPVKKGRKGRSGPNMTLSPCREINGRGRVSACRSARAVAALKDNDDWLDKTCEYMRVYVTRVIMHQIRMDKENQKYRELTDKMVDSCENAKNADQVFDQLVQDPTFISDYFDLMKERALENLTKDNMYRHYADDRNKAK